MDKTKDEMRFTSGPWELEPPTSRRPSRIGVSAANHCCVIYDAPLTAETEANARLIAAAPSMLEALNYLLAAHDMPDRNGRLPHVPAALDSARKALNAALGKD